MLNAYRRPEVVQFMGVSQQASGNTFQLRLAGSRAVHRSNMEPGTPDDLPLSPKWWIGNKAPADLPLSGNRTRNTKLPKMETGSQLFWRATDET